MEQLNYDYLFTGLTLLVWLAPLIILMVVSSAIYITKKRRANQLSATLREEELESISVREVS